MKKSLLSIFAMAGFATTAAAQSTVTVYGLLDAYLEYGKGDVTRSGLNSGGMNGSRVGFKGTEDLGGGLTALYQIENGFAVDTGTVTQGGVLFGRQSLVGVSGSFGVLTVGRQYTPHIIAQGNYDPTEQGVGSAYNNGLFTGFFRANNSIVYSMPSVSGFSGNLMYALGESTGSRGNFVSFNVDKAFEAASVGLVYTRQNAVNDSQEPLSTVMLLGAYKIGVVRFTAGVQRVKNATQVLNVADDRKEFFAGAQIGMGSDTLWLGAAQSQTKDVSGTKARQLTAVYLHPLSKRTTVYGGVTAVQNGSLTQYTFDTATGTGVPVSPGRDAKAIQVGIRHSF